MLLSTQTDNSASRFGVSRAIELIADAGFDAIDLSMFSMVKRGDALTSDGWREVVENYKAVAKAKGIGFNQSHAPFSFADKDKPETYQNVILPLTLRALEVSAMLGVKIMVVHPIHYKDYRIAKKEMHDKSMEYYRALIPYCRDFGVKVALENMWQTNKVTGLIESDTCSSAEEFAAWVDELDSEWITGCLDLGHCGITGDKAAETILRLGADRIGCLHVHDNDHRSDAHTLPGMGKMDWSAITFALKSIGYKGDFTFEADCFLNGFEDDFIPDALRFMERRGRHLIKMIENA